MTGKIARYMLFLVIFAAALCLIYLAGNAFFIWKITDIEKIPVSSTPEDIFLKYEEVEFRSSGGPLLKGWLLNGIEGAPVIIAAHDLGSNKEELLNSVVRMNKAGYYVFLVDFRGHGESSGKTTLGVKETEDIISAVIMLEKDFGFKRTHVGLYGVSMGAYASLAAAETLSGIKAIAADSPYSDVSVILDHTLRKEHSIDFFHPKINRFIFSILSADFSGSDLVNTVSHLKGTNILYLAEESDQFYYSEAERLYRVTDESYANLAALKATARSPLYDEDKRIYEDEVLSFFLSCLPIEKNEAETFDVIIE